MSEEAAVLRVGTSGWQYQGWRGPFSATLPQREWLPYYADRFATVEVNSTFYGLPRRDTVAAWAGRAPADFVFALKMSRYLTHVRRLAEPEDAIIRFFRSVEPLGARAGPVLLQLPPDAEVDVGRLERALRAMPGGVCVAVEFRHVSWFEDGVRRVLERHGAALCLADRGSRPRTPDWRTADWGYVRMHEGRGHPRPCYGRVALQSWAERLAALWAPSDEVYVFFNNDANACAPRDAARFARVAGRAGLAPARVPTPDEVRVTDG